MKLRQHIRLRLYTFAALNILKSILLLTVPAIFATASIWLNWLILIIPGYVSLWITSSYDSLVSIFNVLAGAYLTLFATYTLKKREERQKIIASKELAFYTPMFHEITAAIEYYKNKKIWRFYFDDQFSWGIKWTFWKETQTTLLKYSVPKVFTDKLIELDIKIKQYAEKYSEVSLFCIDIAKDMNKKAGLVDEFFMNGYHHILDDIFLGEFSSKSVKDSVPNCKDISVDCEKLSQDIKAVILDSKEYNDFVDRSNELNELFDEVYDALDYILMKIHKKYRGMNTLL